MGNNTFMANIEQEGRIDQPVRADEEDKETPPESPADKKPEDEPASPADEKGEDATPDSEKGEPKVFEAFHKHPRWIALNQELDELREFREKAAPLLDRLGDEPSKTEETSKIPEWFVELFGENEGSWKKYRDYDVEQRKQLRTEIFNEIRSVETHKKEEEKKWDKWVDTEVQKLEDEGLKFNRNELLKIAVDYAPTGSDGNVSLRKAYQILVATKGEQKPSIKPAVEEKKKIADQTMQKGKPEGERKDYKTPADLRGKSFRDLVPTE
ncbi:MAG: hypothetical protein NUV85_03850 [Candidatus Berkelbacteria bacterium]|nr:hypothetical protein [Candidatus Berkelbacteria bacterium]